MILTYFPEIFVVLICSLVVTLESSYSQHQKKKSILHLSPACGVYVSEMNQFLNRDRLMTSALKLQEV